MIDQMGNEVKMFETVKDCVQALETYVLPNYPNATTTNIGYTKQECFYVLAHLFQMGRINPRMIPQEIEEAVEIFMDSKLWVPVAQVKSAHVAHAYLPTTWFQCSPIQQIKDVSKMFYTWLSNGAFLVFMCGSLFLTNLVRLYKIIKYRLKGDKNGSAKTSET